MTEEYLSQSEIDQLLASMGARDDPGPDLEVDPRALEELGASIFQRVVGPLSTLLEGDVEVEQVWARPNSPEAWGELSGGELVVAAFEAKGEISGSCSFAVEGDRARWVAAKLMGHQVRSELGPTEMNAVSEALSQFAAAVAGLASELTGKNTVVTPPEMERVAVGEGQDLPERLAHEGGLYRIMLAAAGDKLQVYGLIGADLLGPLLEAHRAQAGGARAGPRQPQKMEFKELDGPHEKTAPRNMDLILDVPLQLTVELGRTRMQIRDILSLGPGSIIELDKFAGESVDILVNGKLVARGEVVVIDENFGVRLTEIVSAGESVNHLRGR